MNRGTRRTLSRRRGFTLAELLVAIGLTSVLAVGLYGISIVASQSFQRQQRVSEMQMRLRMGLETLRADMLRAGYMSTPASDVDPMVCPRDVVSVQALQAFRTSPNPTVNPTDNSNIAPVTLRFTGNFASTDEYFVAGISGATISLQHRTTVFQRLSNLADMQRVFLNRLVRIAGTNGTLQFAKVTAVSYSSPTSATLPTLSLDRSVTVIGSGPGCGIAGVGTGATVAPISMVEYRIANVATTQANLYAGAAGLVTNKTDLVRTEFVPNNAGPVAIAGTERVVAEYAVDLDVAPIMDVGDAALTSEPSLRRYAFGDAAGLRLLGASGAAGAQPHRVRGLALRLSVRDRIQDSDFSWVARAAGAPLTRFRVFNNQSGAARVRSSILEVMLNNVASRNLRNP